MAKASALACSAGPIPNSNAVPTVIVAANATTGSASVHARAAALLGP
jgi:hypothetical protein